MPLKPLLIAGLLSCASLCALEPANATPLAPTPTVLEGTTGAAPTQVQWRHRAYRYRHWRHGWHARPWRYGYRHWRPGWRGHHRYGYY